MAPVRLRAHPKVNLVVREEGGSRIMGEMVCRNEPSPLYSDSRILASRVEGKRNKRVCFPRRKLVAFEHP